MKYIIIGAGAAGVNCAKTIRSLDNEGEITIISKDINVYSRCMLHQMINGQRSIEDLNFTDGDLFNKSRIKWIKGSNVKTLNTIDKQVVLEDGNSLIYDKLLIASGSSSFIPPVKNLRKGEEIYGLRNLEDVQRIIEKCPGVKDVVILGGGLVGIDALSGLMEKDINISLVEVSDRILPLQLDKRASSSYEELFREKGIHIHTGVKAEEVYLDESNHVKGLKLNSGETIPCQMIIAATGVRPDFTFLSENTFNIDRGIVVDEHCSTNIADVYAAGDVCGIHPIWPLAVKQGITAAYNMVGIEKCMEDHFGLRNSLNFMGLQTVSLGSIEEDDACEAYTEDDGRIYKKVIVKNNIIQGAILQGDISYCGVYTTLIKNKINISGVNKNVLDINYGDFYSVEEDGSYAYEVSGI